MRLYNPAVCRFLSVDPLYQSYPWNSTYAFAEGDVISCVDLDGGEKQEIIDAFYWAGGRTLTLVKETAISTLKLAATPTPILAKQIGDAAVNYATGGGLYKDATKTYRVVKTTGKMVYSGAYRGITKGKQSGYEPTNEEVNEWNGVAHTGAKGLAKTAALTGATAPLGLLGEVSTVTRAESAIAGEGSALSKCTMCKELGEPLCFAAGTLILTNKGLERIETIAVGDTVWAYSDSLHRTGKQIVYKTFVTVSKHLIKLKVGNEYIYTTPNHPFYIDNKWVKAENIKEGNLLTLFNGSTRIVDSKIIIDTSCTVYNFSVQYYHTYCVSIYGLLVHNSCIDEILSLKELDIAKFGERIGKFDFGNYLKNTLGVSQPKGMYKPHAHHIVMKKGGGEWGVKSRSLLEKYGIDPYFGKENLTWAPNGKGNHTINTAESVYKTLEAAESGGRAGIIDALEELGKTAAKGGFEK